MAGTSSRLQATPQCCSAVTCFSLVVAVSGCLLCARVGCAHALRVLARVIGRFFEGTAKDMHSSLQRVVDAVPPETLVFFG